MDGVDSVAAAAAAAARSESRSANGRAHAIGGVVDTLVARFQRFVEGIDFDDFVGESMPVNDVISVSVRVLRVVNAASSFPAPHRKHLSYCPCPSTAEPNDRFEVRNDNATVRCRFPPDARWSSQKVDGVGNAAAAAARSEIRSANSRAWSTAGMVDTLVGRFKRYMDGGDNNGDGDAEDGDGGGGESMPLDEIISVSVSVACDVWFCEGGTPWYWRKKTKDRP